MLQCNLKYVRWGRGRSLATEGGGGLSFGTYLSQRGCLGEGLELTTTSRHPCAAPDRRVYGEPIPGHVLCERVGSYVSGGGGGGARGTACVEWALRRLSLPVLQRETARAFGARGDDWFGEVVVGGTCGMWLEVPGQCGQAGARQGNIFMVVRGGWTAHWHA